MNNELCKYCGREHQPNGMVTIPGCVLETVERYKVALTEIARYDEESIWGDDRDDAANNMLSVARTALGEVT